MTAIGSPAPSRAPRLRERVGLEVATLRDATAVIVKHHYLHRGRTMAQLPYWISLDGENCGVMLFAYPRLSSRIHGHRPMNVIELARLWLSPSVQGGRIVDSRGTEHSLSVASTAVGMALRRLRQDWKKKYPHLPRIDAVISWADQVHHEGTVYRAVNFREIGTSGGSLHGNSSRANGGRDQLNPDYLHHKTAFMFEYRRRLPAGE